MYFKKVQSRNKTPKYKVGDKVRISVKKDIFEKGFTINWSDKIYTIIEVLKTLPPTYKIKDDREEIKGTFYKEELQKVAEKEVYRISKILKTRTVRGQKEYLIRWYGYPPSFDSWVPKENVQYYE